jgi:Coenzyme PQQ synthesis protein D (PqqD)
MKASISIRSVRSGSGVLLVDANRGDTFGANHVGAAIWKKLQQDISIDQIIDEISAEFSVSREVVREDVQSFLDSLKRHELAK